MSIQIGDNFTYKAKKPLDARIIFNSITDMVGVDNTTIYDGILVYVLSEKKFYTYDSNNTVDVTLDKWRELTTSSITITSAQIDNVTSSSTYKHLILTLSDGTTIDCGKATGDKGDKGDKGDGFAIIKLYTSISDMVSDSTPVSDGQMVGVIDTSTNPVTAVVYIRNSSQTQDSDKNENGYTFFCNLSDATVIQGPKGDKGNTGDKGDTPVITITTVSATASTPEGKKITFTTGTGATVTSVSTTIYNGINLKTASFNASNELILTLTDGSTINLGVLPGTSGNNTSYITILGCYDNTNIPSTCNVGDVYFNTVDNLLYKCSTINTWDTVGSTPTNTDIYISLNDRNLYTYADNTWESYGGGSGSVTISTQAKNALIQNADGLYVQDISDKVNNISISQKTVNTQLEYFAAIGTTKVSLSASTNINYLPYLDQINTNLDSSRYDNNEVTLQKDKTYKITLGILRAMSTNKNGCSYRIVDSDNNYIGSRGYCGSSSFSDNTLETIYTPTEDTKIHPQILSITDSTSIYPDCSFFTVTEINRSIVVDPVQYVNSSEGIEDTPVGEIIQKIGTIPPKHYISCNGSTYNITDYPELAEVIKEEYGSYNNFGGDGVTTFAVPDYSSSKNIISILPVMKDYTQDGYTVSASSEYSSTFLAWKAFNKTALDSYDSWASALDTTTGWLQVEMPVAKRVDKFSITSRNTNASDKTDLVDFELLGSMDGSNWKTITSITNEKEWTTNETRYYDVQTSIAYKYYRINFSKTSSTRFVDIAMFDLYQISYSTFIKYEPTYFMSLSPSGYETLDIDFDTIDVSLGSSNTKVRTLWTYTNNNTQNQPVKLSFKSMTTKTNTTGTDGYVTIDVDDNVIQTIQCPSKTTVKFNVDKLSLQPGQTITFKTNWSNTHTAVTWTLQGTYIALSNSI